MKNKIIIIAAIAIVLVAIAVYYFINPDGVWWFPKCGLYRLTGLKCPICGLQRAFHQFLHGNILAAIRLNYFIPVTAVYWAIVLIITRRNLTNYFYFYCLLAAVWLVVRNILGV